MAGYGSETQHFQLPSRKTGQKNKYVAHHSSASHGQHQNGQYRDAQDFYPKLRLLVGAIASIVVRSVLFVHTPQQPVINTSAPSCSMLTPMAGIDGINIHHNKTSVAEKGARNRRLTPLSPTPPLHRGGKSVYSATLNNVPRLGAERSTGERSPAGHFARNPGLPCPRFFGPFEPFQYPGSKGARRRGRPK